MSTLKQVAAKAGVHVSTASKILHGGTGNSRAGKQARQRVLAAAGQLGYARNEAAHRLRTGTSDWAGLVAGDLRNPFFAELAAALEEKLVADGLRLISAHVAAGDGVDFAQASILLHRQAVRCIIHWEEGGVRKPPVFSRDIPVIPIGFTVRPRAGIWLDLVHAVELCVEHLSRKGFRRIGFFAPRFEYESPSVRIRRDVFIAACRVHRMPAPVLAQWQGESWDVMAATAGAELAWKEHPEAEAWLGFNDVAALGLLMARPKARQKVLAFDGTAIIRSWPRALPCLDLCLPLLARRVGDVMAGKASLNDFGKRKNWIKPTLRNS